MQTNPYASQENTADRTDASTTLITPKRLRCYLAIAATVSLTTYCWALLGEVAWKSGSLGFNEPVTMRHFIDAVGPSTIGSMLQLEPHPCSVVSVAGMLLALGATLFKRGPVPARVVVAYIALFLLSGGWLGLLVLPFMVLPPLSPPDGEFFADHVARYVACAIWGAAVIIYLVARNTWAKQSEQSNFPR